MGYFRPFHNFYFNFDCYAYNKNEKRYRSNTLPIFILNIKKPPKNKKQLKAFKSLELQ